MVVRSSLHRTKYSRTRPNAAKPVTSRELPDALREETLWAYDSVTHDLRRLITDLVGGVPSLGSFRDAANPLLENFTMDPEAWDDPAKQEALTDAVLDDEAFLSAYELFVEEDVLPYIKARLVAADPAYDEPTTFFFQRPPTLRLQPGPSERYVACHDDARYGHQAGELNLWLPLTDYALTETTLWAESTPGAGDFRPLEAKPGEAAVFWGSKCKHKVPPNPTSRTRVSLDFRIGVGGCFDPDWVLRGTKDDHARRSIVL